MTFSSQLLALRKHYGETQKQFAGRLKISRQYLVLLENEKREPSEQLAAMVDLMKRSLEMDRQLSQRSSEAEENLGFVIDESTLDEEDEPITRDVVRRGNRDDMGFWAKDDEGESKGPIRRRAGSSPATRRDCDIKYLRWIKAAEKDPNGISYAFKILDKYLDESEFDTGKSQ